MPILPQLTSSDAEKLATLQRLDRHRDWRSLEDKRYCLRCGRVISGFEIRIVPGGETNESEQLKCATPDCESIPMDWVLPTEEVLMKMSILPQRNGRG
jgi:hypothetical protein